MDAGSLPDALKTIMEQRDWSQARLARELGVSQVWVSQVSRGRRDPGFARAAGYLARVGLDVRISVKVEDPVERRTFMAAAASVAFVPSAAANPYQDADYLRTLTATMARHRYELGGTPLAPKALSHSQRVLGAVENSRDRDLQAAASAFLNQATLILYDAGRLSPAERLGGRSLDLATRSADTEGQARAYDALSRVSLYRGDSSRAVMYARRGLRIRGITDVQRALLNMRLGRSLALVPERGDDSMAALETALTLGAPSPFGKAALGGDVGIGLGVLGRYREAGSLLREAADSMGRRSPLFRAQYLGRQAQTALRAADPSLAAVHIHAFARAVPLVTSARVGRRAQEIFRASDAWRTVPELGQARDHLRTVLPAA